MKELSIREVQAECLEMLRFLDAFCRKHGLDWYLSGGTLLGAVRHKGFIPWDDDADIMLPRASYERLLSLAGEIDSGSPYRLMYIGKDDTYHRCWARLCDTRTARLGEGKYFGEQYGVFVDIYPIDGAPAGRLAGELYFRRMRFWDVLNKVQKLKRFRHGERLLRLIAKPLRLIGPIPFAKRMSRVPLRYDYDTSPNRCVALACSHYWTREIMPAEVFDHAVPVRFEDMTLPAPRGWDHYLRALYGNYMEIPEKYRGQTEFDFTHDYRYGRPEEGDE